MKDLKKTWWAPLLGIVLIIAFYNPFPIVPNLVEDACFQCAPWKKSISYAALLAIGVPIMILMILILWFMINNLKRLAVFVGVVFAYLVVGAHWMESKGGSVFAEPSFVYFVGVVFLSVTLWLCIQAKEFKAE